MKSYLCKPHHITFFVKIASNNLRMYVRKEQCCVELHKKINSIYIFLFHISLHLFIYIYI